MSFLFVIPRKEKKIYFKIYQPCLISSLTSQVPLCVPQASPKPRQESGHVNEQILRLMQSLGIDPARTKEVNIQYTHQVYNEFWDKADRVKILSRKPFCENLRKKTELVSPKKSVIREAIIKKKEM